MRVVAGGGSDRSRPSDDVRARLLCLGGRALSDAELLALVLDGGTGGEPARRDAAAFLEDAVDVSRLGRVVDTTAAGVSVRRRAVIHAALELGRRAAATPLHAGLCVRDAASVWAHFAGRLPQLAHEVFYVLLLDGRNRLQAEVRVSEGSLTSTLVHPREVFGPAIRWGAAAVVLVHNHPSGDPQPSAEDDALTLRLRQAGDLVGIRVLDHVVIGQGAFVSMAERGRW